MVYLKKVGKITGAAVIAQYTLHREKVKFYNFRLKK